ncbi:hypothetical protein PV326_006889 [Microctonus aethiopoides]|nr:hypothetical protein PV326_006889 [Microctonus aethiopoides]
MKYNKYCRLIQTFLILSHWMIIKANKNTGRYLLFPPPSNWAPTKLQLIAGLGLPMEIDVSTIVGYVMKFNYVLPYNASYFTDSYVRHQRSIDSYQDMAQMKETLDLSKEAGSISRWEIYRMIESSLEGFSSGRSCLLRVICETAAVPFRRSHGIVAQLLHILLTPSTTSEEYEDNEDQEYLAAEEIGKKDFHNCEKLFHECNENILEYFTEIKTFCYDRENVGTTVKEVTKLLSRTRRTLVYPKASDLLLIFGLGTPLQLDRESVIVGAFTKLLYSLPANSTDFSQPGVYFARNVEDDNGGDDSNVVKKKSRWSIYKVLEKMGSVYGFGGKACLLRAICDVAATPFDSSHGLFGQLIQAILTPSSTSEPYEDYYDREYHAAEKLGRHVDQNCHALYPECQRSALDVFSTTDV